MDNLRIEVVNTSKSVRDVLLEKHPPAKPPVPAAVCEPDDNTAEPHPVQFDGIDGPFIHSTVLRMDVAAEPSGTDAAGLKRQRTFVWHTLC